MIGILREYSMNKTEDDDQLISISVTLMALIRRPSDLDRSFKWNAQKGASVYQVLTDLGYSRDEIRFFHLFVTKDGGKTQKVTRKHILQAQDELFITIPVGGGI